MNTLDAIYGRRAIKHYDKGHSLTESEERHLLEATTQSPSSFNIQHWRLVIPGSAVGEISSYFYAAGG